MTFGTVYAARLWEAEEPPPPEPQPEPEVELPPPKWRDPEPQPSKGGTDDLHIRYPPHPSPPFE